MKFFLKFLFLIMPISLFADLDPVTLREVPASKQNIISNEKKGLEAKESLARKLGAYASREDFFQVHMSGLMVFPRRGDWDFTGGAELGIGYRWGRSGLDFLLAWYQSHSSRYGMYESAVPVLLSYTHYFEYFSDNTFVPYASFGVGTQYSLYTKSGQHRDDLSLMGSLGLGAQIKLMGNASGAGARGGLSSASLKFGYRFDYVYDDSVMGATGMSGGHVLNLGLDFRF